MRPADEVKLAEAATSHGMLRFVQVCSAIDRGKRDEPPLWPAWDRLRTMAGPLFNDTARRFSVAAATSCARQLGESDAAP